MEDSNWSADLRGAPGEEVALHLLLRLVADVGIVGLPNAGKSSLLARLTRCGPCRRRTAGSADMCSLGQPDVGKPCLLTHFARCSTLRGQRRVQAGPVGSQASHHSRCAPRCMAYSHVSG